MNPVTNVWQSRGDPRSVGLQASPGERCADIFTGTCYTKKGYGLTDWILADEAYGGGGSDTGNVDGGNPTSIYGGSIAIDGGSP